MKSENENLNSDWRVGCYWPGVAVGLTVACGFFGGIRYSQDEINMWVFGPVPFRAVIGEILFDNIGPAYLSSVGNALPFILATCSCAWLLSGLTKRKYESLFLASAFGGLVGSVFFCWDEYLSYHHYGPNQTLILTIVCLLCSLGSVFGSVILNWLCKNGDTNKLCLQYSLKQVFLALTVCCMLLGAAVATPWELWNLAYVWCWAFSASQMIAIIALVAIAAVASFARR